MKDLLGASLYHGSHPFKSRPGEWLRRRKLLEETGAKSGWTRWFRPGFSRKNTNTRTESKDTLPKGLGLLSHVSRASSSYKEEPKRCREEGDVEKL